MAPNPPTSGGPPKLKIKFGGGGGATTSAAVAPPAASPPAVDKPAKRKYNRKPKPDADESPIASKTPKKRVRKDENDDLDSPDDDIPLKKIAKTSGLKLRIGSSNKPPPEEVKPDDVSKVKAPTSAPSISFKKKDKDRIKEKNLGLKLNMRTSSQIVRLVNNKAASQLPPREPGTGYDSEAESVEDDPAIEQQFVIRMLPNEDCEYLREAITQRKVGASAANGGADVRMRFLQRDGRRSMLSIRGNNYVAFLVDLPCIVESMKSWDRKNYYKSADIHQMLLVTQKVKDESEARNAEMPGNIGIESGSWQYPHGLTPPMHWVRKRRFRKRVSHRTIEEVESQVERLLELDDQCWKEGGTSEITIFDPLAGEESDEDDELDAEGEDDLDGAIQQSIENMDMDAMGVVGDDEDDAFAAMMAEELGREDYEDAVGEADADGETSNHKTITGRMLASPETMTQNTSTPGGDTGTGVVQTAAASENSSMPPPAGNSSARLKSSSEQPRQIKSEDEEEDDSDDDDDESELDEEEKAAQQEKAQQREEIAEMETEIKDMDKRIASMKNVMLRKTFTEKREKLVRDLKLKKINLGEVVESDEE